MDTRQMQPYYVVVFEIGVNTCESVTSKPPCPGFAVMISNWFESAWLRAG